MRMIPGVVDAASGVYETDWTGSSMPTGWSQVGVDAPTFSSGMYPAVNNVSLIRNNLINTPYIDATVIIAYLGTAGSFPAAGSSWLDYYAGGAGYESGIYTENTDGTVGSQIAMHLSEIVALRQDLDTGPGGVVVLAATTDSAGASSSYLFDSSGVLTVLSTSGSPDPLKTVSYLSVGMSNDVSAETKLLHTYHRLGKALTQAEIEAKALVYGWVD